VSVMLKQFQIFDSSGVHLRVACMAALCRASFAVCLGTRRGLVTC
jgi:hypothetical protein